MQRFLYITKLISAFFILAIGSLSSRAQNILPLGSGLQISGSVYCITYDSLTDRTFIGGYFSQVNDVPANNIAWHDVSGWHAFGSGTDAYVITLEFANGILYAGGGFSVIDDVPADHVAQWNGTAWLPMGSGIPGAYLRSMIWYDSRLYVSGYFLSAGGVNANNIASWNGNTWEAAGSGSNNYYVYLAEIKDTLYAYGRFTLFNGDPTAFSKFNGVTWEPVIPDTLNFIGSLTLHHDTLFANVYSAANPYQNKIVYLDSGVWTDYIPGVTQFGNSFLCSYHDTLICVTPGYSSGDTLFANFISSPTNIQKQGLSVQGNHNYYEIFSFKIINADLYVLGFINNLHGKVASGALKYNGVTWSVPFYTSVPYYDPWYNAWGRFFLYDSITTNLYVSGKFCFAGNVVSPNIAMWDGNTWHPMGDGLAGDDVSTTGRMIFYKDTLYVCGTFTHSGDSIINGIAKWNGQQWLAVGGYCDGTVQSMAVYQNMLYVVGDFSIIGNIQADNFAMYDGVNWHTVPLISNTYLLSSVCADHSKLYLAGNHFNAGTYTDFAVYDGVQWTIPVSYPPGIESLYFLNDTLYAAKPSSVHKYNGTNWNSVGYSGNSSSHTYLSMMHDRLLIGDWWENATFVKDGTGWTEFMHHEILSCHEIDSTSTYITGFLPYTWPGYKPLNNIGKLISQPPAVNVSFNEDSICDHEYVFYSGPFNDISVNYDWYFEGGTPSNFSVINPIVHYLNAGDFDVQLIVSNVFGADTMILTDTIHVEDCTLLQATEAGWKKIKIYPNPFQDGFTVTCDGFLTEINLQDMQGKTISQISFGKNDQQTEAQVETKNLKPGMYILQLHTTNGISSYKLIRN